MNYLREMELSIIRIPESVLTNGPNAGLSCKMKQEAWRPNGRTRLIEDRFFIFKNFELYLLLERSDVINN